MKRKRTSEIIQQAESRAAALRPIEGKLDFGKSLSLAVFIAKIGGAREHLAKLNAAKAETEAARVALNDAEAELKDLSGRILKAVLAQFGPNSEEYAMVGGTRTSDRKRPARRGNDSAPASPADSPKPA